jgi:metal-dependent amidase/aminoacylase/carboxypeptidase family protein
VVGLGQIQGGDAYTVIAGTVTLRGTLRTLRPGRNRDLARRVARVARHVCRAHRAQCRFTYEAGHPALVNHPRATDLARRAGREVLGPSGVREISRPVMTGEDFTYFAQAAPACFFRVGVGGAKPGWRHPWHHPRFDFDERGLAAGAAVMAQAALDYLQ